MINLPLFLTVSRFLAGIIVPVFIYIDVSFSTLIALFAFIAGALSDAADGEFARRRSQQTDFGAFVDPIADKFLVFMVLITLIFTSDSIALFLISLVIILREVLVMSLREWMSMKGHYAKVKVAIHGKIKTIIQMTGISMIIGSPLFIGMPVYQYFYDFSLVVLGIGALIGIYSGLLHFKNSLGYLKD